MTDAPLAASPRPPDRHAQHWRVIVPLLGALCIAIVPAPEGLASTAWLYVAVFVGVILALITEPIAPSAVGFIGVTFAAAAGLPFSEAQRADPAFNQPAEAVRWALSGFSNPTVWLIFSAFMFALGYEKTGLGRRISLVLVRSLGHRTLGLGYAIALSDVLVAPFTPSNTARSAGLVYPVIRGIPELYGSAPGESARRVGAYVMWVAFATTCVTSSMFVTALAPNLLLLTMARDMAGVHITWADWFLGFLPIGAVLLLALPWLVYRLYPPGVRASSDVPRWAAGALRDMGPVRRHEVTMAVIASLALLGWIFAGNLLDPTLVAMAAVALMLVLGVVSWDDVVRHTAAWNVLAWFATLVALADGLNRVGFVGWLGRSVAARLSGAPPTLVLIALVVFFFLVHYMFAGLTAQTTAVGPVMLAAALGIDGVPMREFVLLLGFSLGIMGVLTPYATGPAPLYYGCGFIRPREFWRLGALFGGIFLVTLLAIGVPWLRWLSR